MTLTHEESTQTQVRGMVWEALATVADPELDQPVTELDFIASCEVTTAGEVTVQLRLPTYFCAPNFAFLMIADSHDAVAAVPGVRATTVELVDHFAADAINRGVAARAGFVDSFDGEAVDELDELRANFLRKAVLAGTDRVCREMINGGTERGSLIGLTLGDAPATTDRERLRARRRELGLSSGDGDPLLVDVTTGRAVETPHLRTQLGMARVARVNQEANAGICRGMLAERYPGAASDVADRADNKEDSA